MPTLEWNRVTWENYAWAEDGDEWSAPWGGSAAQWYGALLPRIHRWVPADTILEIAPGFGRWTQYLAELAGHLTVVDLSEKCIQACRARFGKATNITYDVNDGRSLPASDRSVDFIFSFDSLVHAEFDVLLSYLGELGRVLKRDGVAFIHHSNLGAYPAKPPQAPDGVNESIQLSRRRATESHHRAESVSAERVSAACELAGLCCVVQELVSWTLDDPVLSDCISVLTPVSSAWASGTRVEANQRFMAEASLIAARERLYSGATTEVQPAESRSPG